ncbi:MAG: helix-turn-helix domain-containing protein [Azospirillum sp.]|nr:helix-turn-helix domain-containing protein [Azospirillum sp.]
MNIRFAPVSPGDEVRHLNQKQLARRWGMSHRTLERWRCRGQGPAWLKVGGRVLYRVEDIERYEGAKMAKG